MSWEKVWKAVEEKWQSRWREAKIFEADPDPSKPKFFITFPYPYMSGPLHVGHGYTGSRVDVIARFKRMQGFNVLFPWAWHWTGETVAGASERIKLGDEKFIQALKVVDRVPEEELKKFADPVYMAKYYTEYNREAVKKLGLSIDWRREFHTTSFHPFFSRFVDWQYRKLKEGNYVVKGTHPVVWCPKCQSPTGEADRLEGSGVTPEEYVLIKFKMNGAYLPAATFRPETIFGATNLWLNPEADYVEASVNGEHWIISKRAAEKLREQLREVEILKEFKGAQLLGKKCLDPLMGRELPLLPGWFVNPEDASGVVYSVPAHAPYDWLALKDLQENPAMLERFGMKAENVKRIKPISIIKVEGFGEYPALEAVDRLGVKDQKDPKAEEATQLVYKREFHKGVLKENCGSYAGRSVAEVKERLTQEFKEKQIADAMYDLPQPVVCRCTTPCTIKILRDQWFLNYSNPEWKKKARELLSKLQVYPEDARRWFEAVIEWLHDWACARKTGLGTPLPWASDWIVETLSDSTVYPAFYTVNKYIQQENIAPEQLTEEVFDYIFYGKGKLLETAGKVGLRPETLDAMRREFLYWYPVDLRNSGKDLVPNHLTFYIFHHAALFPPEHWPKAIGVNGFMRVEGEEMHKSKGNFIPLRKAVEEHGADATRCAVLLAAEGMDDPDWRASSLKEVKAHLQAFHKFVLAARALRGKETPGRVERWLISTLNRRVEKVTKALEALKTRTALETAFYEVWNDLRWYMRRNSLFHQPTLREAVEVWIRLLTPFIPHTCEEVWETMGKKPFAATLPWPTCREEKIDAEAEEVENTIKIMVEDTRHILKVTEIKPKKICYYTAEPWKWEIYLEALKRGNLKERGTLIRELMARPSLREKGASAAKFVNKTLEAVVKLPEEMRKKRLLLGKLDEKAYLEEAKPFLEKEFRCPVAVYRADDPEAYDPQRKAALSEPYRPGIYVK
ncbi:leucine--tRNA ligase [Candidatus Hecatella orcuttiae]|jgi:leucyl-tRNA synthetase|uniref:leucine--tRNA ligase n=1 Tax=Candidatus Hecatella orcuttiae TaxID=1935119 RepID=UPI0028680C14|nr:leucine--tRNA ligase [Candidatus Hecatella orcuttiae]